MAGSSRTREESLDDGSTVYRGCVSKTLNVTAVLQIIAGALSIVLGISAIILKAFMSYLGFPIWGGLLIFIVAGSLGVAHYYKPRSKKIVKWYLAMSIVSEVFSFSMIVAFSLFVGQENWFWVSFRCQPLMLSSCESQSWSRILINSLLIAVFSLEMIIGLIATFDTCYLACQCCVDGVNLCKRCRPFKICSMCIKDPRNSNVMYYAVNMGDGGMRMMAVPNPQGSAPIYREEHDGSSGTPPGQFMFVASSPQHQTFVPLPAVTQEDQNIPRLPPPPQNQRSQQHNQPVLVPQQQPVLIPQPVGITSGQTGFMQVQAPWQNLQQVQTRAQSTPEQHTSGLPGGQYGFAQVQGPNQMFQVQGSGQMQPQVLSLAQSTLEQQKSGLPGGQSGFVQVQSTSQMQPQVLDVTQSTAEQQRSDLRAGQSGLMQVQASSQMQPQILTPMQLVPAGHPAGTPQQWGGFPSGRLGYFQVQGPGGQVQMIPAMYPQAVPGLLQASQEQAGPGQAAPEQVGPIDPEPTQENVQQITAPSTAAEDHVDDEDLDLTEAQVQT